MKTNIGQILLMPFSFLYGLGVWFRQFLYRIGLLRRTSFDLPLVSVGNLSAGGSGKSPHVEYLIRLLQPYVEVGTLSRGYGRRTEGFRIVQPNSPAEDVGDEPLQFKQKFPEITVAVGERRAEAIPLLVREAPHVQVVLLDDALQHLAVKPYVNVLLTEFDAPFTQDWLLPSGRLREFRSGANRADLIVVSKCPPPSIGGVSEAQRSKMTAEIAPQPHQQVFFSYYKYFNPYAIFAPHQTLVLDKNTDVLLVCGIAKTDYLQQYVRSQVADCHVLPFSDHHPFTNFDLGQVKAAFDNMSRNNPRRVVVLTTEKDAKRLARHAAYIQQNAIPIVVLPIEVDFLFDQKSEFDQIIKEKLLHFKI